MRVRRRMADPIDQLRIGDQPDVSLISWKLIRHVTIVNEIWPSQIEWDKVTTRSMPK